MPFKLKQPSPGLVVACIALVIALGPAVRAANTVGSEDIIDKSIQSVDIKDGEVQTSDIGDAAVTAGKLAADAVTGAAISDGSVGSADLANFAVVNSKLAPGAVTTNNVVDNTLTSADLKGADVTRPLNVAAGVVAIGRCRDINLGVTGAQVGEVAVLSLKAPAPTNILIEAIRVPLANVVTVKVCNLSGAASPSISNLPLRIMTFG